MPVSTSPPPSRIIYANPVARERVEKDVQQIYAMQLHDLLPELDWDEYHKFLQSTAKKARFNLRFNGSDCSLFCRKQTGHIHIEMHCRPSRDVELEKESQFLRLLTGRLKQEAVNSIQKTALLLKENDYLKRILNDFPLLIAMKDAQLNYIYVNAEFCRFIGVTQDEIIGKSDDQICSPEQSKYFQDIDRKVIETGKAITTEDAYTDRNGVQHYLITKKVPVQDRDGNIAIQLVCVEITDMKMHETEMEIATQQYEGVSRIANSFVWGVSSDLKPLFFSPSAEDFYGYSTAEISSMDYHDLLSEKTFEHTKELVAELWDLHQNKQYHEMTKTRTTVLECIHKDGRIILADVRYAAVLDRDNNFVSIRGITIQRL